MFNFYNLLIGNRPSVFVNMELKRFTDGNAHAQVSPDGSKYYFLATSAHKTATNFVAYIYMNEHLWNLLCIYIKHIRPKPVNSNYEKYLFLNSSGKCIYNATHDLTSWLPSVDPELVGFTNTDFRKLVTTLGRAHLPESDNQTLHCMLSHSAATADRHYLQGNDQALPHKAGLPLLGRIYSACSADRQYQYFNGTDALSRDMTPDNLSTLNRYREMQQRQVGTASATASATVSVSATVLPPCPSSPTLDKSLSPVVRIQRLPNESSLSVSSKISSKAINNIDRMRALMNTVQFSAEQKVPNAHEIRNLISSNPQFHLTKEPKVVKALSGIAHTHIMRMRTDHILHDFRRILSASDLQSRVETALNDRSWYSKKQVENCMTVAKNRKMQERNSARVMASERLNKTERDIDARIKSQQWSGLQVVKTGVAGLGIRARTAFAKGSVLCDYHGELLDDKSGCRRYDIEYKSKPNNKYMFQFGFEGKKMD
jgi:hypothetical protein